MFNSGQAKIDKYYKLTDKTPVYLTALVLYLSRKWRYIKKHWNSEQILSGKERVKDFWERLYKPALSTLLSPSITTINLSKNDFFEWLKDNDDKSSTDDEYARYCALPQILGIKLGYEQWLKPT